MKRLFVGGRWATLLSALVVVLATGALFAPGARAVLIHVGRGQIAGVMPVRGVGPASIPGSFARKVTAPTTFSSNGNLDYHGGAVLHASAPYLVFWDPNNEISPADKALYERHFADGAADSGNATNVFSVDRQFTDSTGFADYSQVFPASHAITDTQPYPTSGQCTASLYGEPTCLYDAQLQGEVSRLIAADGLPTGITGSAPIYFVVTPPSVNSCFPDGTTCADNFFCAYHSSFTDGGSTVLYADIATVLDANDPKSCQYDGNSAVQEPNGSSIADVALKAVSHELNETITDPVNGGGWYDNATGNENGDNCNDSGTNSNAFLPTLGGDPTAGSLYNQIMNGNHYYVQSEWSNGDVNCEMQPTSSALTTTFDSSTTPGTTVSFDPSGSASSGGYTSTTWSFGDGSRSFSPGAPAAASHTYSAFATYTVTLTLVDTYGNLSTATRTVHVEPPPSAAFGVTTALPVSGSPVGSGGVSGATGGGGTGGGRSVSAPTASKLRVSAAAFRAAASGPSATISTLNQKKHPMFGAKVSYSLNLAAAVRFTVTQRLPGRTQGHGKTARCVARTGSNRKAHHCTRTVTVRGSFTQPGTRGTNSFHFSGRLNGHKLKPGSYTLVATPSKSGKTGPAVTITFRIIP